MSNFSFDCLDREIKQLQKMQVQNDFASFVKNTVVFYSDAPYLNDFYKALQQFSDDVKAKRCPRLIINMPPRSLKSETASIRLPLWFMLNNPHMEVILASANQDLANTFSRKARDLLEEAYIKNNWIDTIAPQNKAIEKWSLTNKSTFKAVGIGGQSTGFGADILVVDDPLKDMKQANSLRTKDDHWEWFDSVADTRMAPGGGIIIVLTRWAEDDIAGRLIKHFPEDWKVIKYKAIADEDEDFRKKGEVLHPLRYPIERMLKIKSNKSPQVWYSLYQQEPRVREGNLFKYDFFQNFYYPAELPPQFDFIVTSWDLSFSATTTSDYVAGVTLGLKDNQVFVLALVHGRFDFPQTKSKVLENYATFIPNATLIEAKANGQAIVDSIKGIISGVVPIVPKEDKVSRANAIIPMFEANQVKFPANTDWLLKLTDECLGFPRSPHDDIVDALTQGLNYLREKINKYLLCDDLDFDGMEYQSEFNAQFFSRFRYK